ncbi:thioredoxin-like protein [Mucilaginibacter gracilis]|uniref:Thioredoxin-like protein n=1 Tax=Mucilaginibacter gracilis TaxID=423350 RepID=A0A495JAY6_9SPHI|nr:thioredoxin family protein [Mucilaginibacter gracilis]RKR85648.1 thioredoxin-like protein [Mucilaginibacter gracilis]
MKKLLCLFLLFYGIANVYAQKPAAINTLPKYKLLRSDSTWVTQANLKKGKPVMIIYFAPDCSHCQRLTYEMQEEFKKETKLNLKPLAHVQIVMATWAELRAIKVFYNDFGLVKYPNITVGTEGNTYTLLRFYNVSTTPYIAIYSKTGQLVKAFAKVPKFEEIMAVLNKV